MILVQVVVAVHVDDGRVHLATALSIRPTVGSALADLGVDEVFEDEPGTEQSRPP
jgi:hypothetical protein